MINLESIEAFVCIVESKSFRSAAKMMNKSQPVLTYHVKQLELYLGYELFDRSHYRVQLTPHGKQFLPNAIRMLETASDIEKQRHQSDKYVEPQLNLSVSSLYPLHLLTSTLQSIQTMYPETAFQFSTDTLSGHEKVRKKMVDLAITEFPVQDVSLQQEPIFEFNMVLSISNHHPLRSTALVTVADLLRYPQIVLRSSGPSVEDRGILSAAKQWSVSDMVSKFDLIRQGLGWGYLPDYLLNDPLYEKQFLDIHVEELPAAPVTLYKTMRRYQDKGPVIQALWDTMG